MLRTAHRPREVVRTAQAWELVVFKLGLDGVRCNVDWHKHQSATDRHGHQPIKLRMQDHPAPCLNENHAHTAPNCDLLSIRLLSEPLQKNTAKSARPKPKPHRLFSRWHWLHYFTAAQESFWTSESVLACTLLFTDMNQHRTNY